MWFDFDLFSSFDRIEYVLNTVAFLGPAIIYWARMYHLVCAGQEVMTQMQNSKDALEDHVMAVGFSKLDRDDQEKIHTVNNVYRAGLIFRFVRLLNLHFCS
jgi:hypothetical protein